MADRWLAGGRLAAHKRDMTTSTPHTRQPAGTPVGGQFAPSANAAPRGVTLVEETSDQHLRDAREAALSRALRAVEHAGSITQHLFGKAVTAAVPDARRVTVGRFLGEVEVELALDADGREMRSDEYTAIAAVLTDHAADFDEYLRVTERSSLTVDVDSAAASEPPTATVQEDANGRAVVPVSTPVTLGGRWGEDLPAWPADLDEPDVTFQVSDGRIETVLVVGGSAIEFGSDPDGQWNRVYDADYGLDEDVLGHVAEYGDAVHARIDTLAHDAFHDVAGDATLAAEIVRLATRRD